MVVSGNRTERRLVGGLASALLLLAVLGNDPGQCVPVPVDPCGPAYDSRCDERCLPVGEPEPLGLSETAEGPLLGTVFWLEPSPHDPRDLFAGAGDDLFRSLDGGQSWAVVSFPVPHNGTQGIAFHPTDADRYYVALSYYGDSTLVGTTDDGLSWTTLGLDPSLVAEAVTTDPNTPERILVGTHWDGVWQSRDGGATFTQTGMTLGGVLHVLVDPDDPQRLYVGCWGNEGFYRSLDGGATWTAPGGPGQSLAALALDPDDPQTLYAVVYGAGQFWDTLFRSRDGGSTWQPLYDGQLGGRGLYGFFVDPCDTDRLYLGARNAVVRSLDGGETWTHQPEGFVATSNVPVYGFGRSPERLFAASEGCGLYESLDQGTTWHHLAGLLCDNAPTIGF